MEPRHVILLALVIKLASTTVVQPPAVLTNSGPVSGTRLNVGPRVVDEYLGIPYAKPPVGNLRYRKPQPVDPWSDVWQATEKTPACMQSTSKRAKSGSVGTISEDCLHLNLWVPQDDPSLTSETTPKAIMVWIFPGRFLSGSMNVDVYDGSTLAAFGDVIVASMNYRLGQFGFMYAHDEEAPGNVGLLDQVLALSWIKDNALAFGGDPGQITLFGESSGSVAVGMHLLSPLSKGLFARALLQGRSPLYRYGEKTPNSGIDLAEKFAEAVGCSDDEKTLLSSPTEVMTCLREKDPQELVDAEKQFGKTAEGRFYPRYGDEFMPMTPVEAVRKGQFSPGYIFAGSNSNEGGMFFLNRWPEVYNSTEVPKISKEQAKAHIKAAFEGEVTPTADEIADFYIDDIAEDDYEALVKAVFDSLGDSRVVCPTVFFSEAYSQSDNPVYYFVFDHHPSNSPTPSWFRMTHIEEIQFVFGSPLKNPAGYTREEQDLSLSTIRKWSSFAKFGEPKLQGHSRWPRYAVDDHTFLVLKTGALKHGHGPNLPACAFWRKYYT